MKFFNGPAEIGPVDPATDLSSLNLILYRANRLNEMQIQTESNVWAPQSPESDT